MPMSVALERSGNRHSQRFAAERTGRSFESYADVHAWSVEDLEGFWSLAWEWLAPIASRQPDATLENADAMPGARFFPGLIGKDSVSMKPCIH